MSSGELQLVFVLGDKLPTIYEAAITIYSVAQGPKTQKMNATVNSYTNALIEQWEKAFGKQHVMSRKSVKAKVVKLANSYYSEVYNKAHRSKVNHRTRPGPSQLNSLRKLNQLWRTKVNSKNDFHGTERYSVSRNLLSTAEWEKCDNEIGHTRNYTNSNSWHAPSIAKAWVGLYVVLTLIIFVAVAIVCDDFFVPSLEAISEKLNLSEDVAGATFMAAGSSAPELFTSIAGVTVESDVGVGTIVGSAVFNLLGICALAAAFAGNVLHLDWRPLTRDTTFYAMSICFFIIFAWDGKFEYYESIIMLLNYFLYILIMRYNPKLMELMGKCGRKKINPSLDTSYKCESGVGNNGKNESSIDGSDLDEESKGVETNRKFSHKSKGILVKEVGYQIQLPSIVEASVDGDRTPGNASREMLPQSKSNISGETALVDNFSIVICPCFPPVPFDLPTRHGKGCLDILRFILGFVLFIVSFPFIILFTWTIPNCSTKKTKKFYMWSFIMSIAWIAALTFGIVTLVGRTGCILGVDKFTMGLVVVAIGTSIPDALSSVLVARDGYGDMAVSNAIGSNVFDIDLGIGLPFLISSLIRNMEPVKLLSHELQIKFDAGNLAIMPHVKFGFILLIILLMSLIIFACCRFRLNKKLGICFLLLYISFVVYAYIQDIYCDNNC